MSDEPAASPPPPAKKKSLALRIAIALVVGLGALAGYIALQPDEFRVSRSITVAAPPQAVFDEINDFRRWEAWSPWAKLDPAAKNTFEGPSSGTGAVFKWSGNNQVGEGSMTITDSRPHDRIQIRLEFTKPMQDASDVEFTFQPDGERTNVSWTMSGQYEDFLGKAMCFVMNMDKMIGEKFEEGLATIKKVVESKS
jgi:uncharacterized protein YndB with AHSA1/START domain